MATDPLTLTLLTAKTHLNTTFSSLASALGRDEVAVAGIFYGAVSASPADINALAEALQLDRDQLQKDFNSRYVVPGGFPSRGVGVEMPPKEPLIYRLYEIVMNYGWAYKAVLNEMFGDGIVSAIAFSTNVKKEVEEDGS
ncbi:Cyanase C-terminal domain-containing protein [Ascobolus immersus RN42]|uniref:Cyanase C-terminal domain-containing protein n=1 Tax=Ascobolus immersus RN42 TaxID=1160509 RepID=A0A3N4IDP4_ASCIM|nr:Cyanase C-terminal domain-containing protein [Ascobolus immersus RN42]